MNNKVIPVDSYLFDVLMRDLVGHDHSAAAFLVYLQVWRHAGGRRGIRVPFSLQRLAAATGLSKSGVQSGLKVLKRRRLIGVTRASATAVPEYILKKHWL